MRKRLKEKLKINRLIKIVVAVAIIVAGAGLTLYGVVADSTAPETVEVSTTYNVIPKYMEGVNVGLIKTERGAVSYCMDHGKKFPSGDVMTRDKQLDAGFTYLLTNGYPQKSITGDNNKDYFITQLAVWWYLDETTGSSNLSTAVKTNSSDPQGLRPYAKNLVEKAKQARTEGYAEPKINASIQSTTMTKNDLYYESGDITVKGTNTNGNYTVTATGADNIIITDASGNVKTVFKDGDKFRVKVLASSVSETASIAVTIKTTGTFTRAYQYKPDNSNTQRMTPSTIYQVTEDAETKLNLSVSTSKLTVSKQDYDTKAPLAGAEFKLYDSNNRLVASWTSSESDQVISNLAPGKYTLKEIVAPDGYNMLEQSITVTVEAGKDNRVVVYNKKQEPTELIIIKRDRETGAVLPGATLALKDAKGNIVSTWETTENGHRFQKIPEGKYTVVEMEAPAGYELSKEEIVVELVAGKTATVTFYNQKKPDIPKTTKVRISKRDITTEQELPGATLVLKNSQGEVVDEWTSGNEEHFIEGLPEGHYSLEETVAPDGYVLYTEKIEFDLKADDIIQDVIMYNTPETPVPDTGESMSKTAVIAGITMMLIGIGIVYTSAKKEENI